VATGNQALFSNTDGQFNTANGSGALDLNTTGDSNTAIGDSALQSNVDGDNNTAIGDLALSSNTGSDNTAIGRAALFDNTTGSNNIAIGSSAGSNVVTANNVICIGAGLAGADVSDSCYIRNIFGQPGGSQAVFVDSNGKLGAQVSSRRFKEEIKPMDKASEALFSLKPVSFRYKKDIDPAGTSQFGLVAEDVEKINPDLVIHAKDGKPYTVRYDQVNAMLLNEFLKEHKKVEQLKSDYQATVAHQQKEIEFLTAQLKEQAAQIQKVSAHVEMSKPAAKVVVKNP
jgi:hypothetical protein